MTKNKAKTFSGAEQSILLFYNEMKWILSSEKEKKFQFMMLNRTLEAVLYHASQTKQKEKEDPLPESPLDTHWSD